MKSKIWNVLNYELVLYIFQLDDGMIFLFASRNIQFDSLEYGIFSQVFLTF